MNTSIKSKPRRKPTHLRAPSDNRAMLARRLDLLADCELQHGHHVAAERLARRAAELRGAA